MTLEQGGHSLGKLVMLANDSNDNDAGSVCRWLPVVVGGAGDCAAATAGLLGAATDRSFFLLLLLMAGGRLSIDPEVTKGMRGTLN